MSDDEFEFDMPVAELYAIYQWDCPECGHANTPWVEVKGVQKCDGCNTSVFMELLGRTLNL